MTSPTRSPSDRPKGGQETPSPDGGPLSLVRRILHRKDPSEQASLNSLGSSKAGFSSPPSIVERLEGFFTHDLPSRMEVLPTETEEPSAPARRNGSEKSASSAIEPKPAAKDSASMPSEFMAVRSIRLAVKDAIARSQDAYKEIETNLKNHAREFDQRHEALAAAAENASTNIQQLSAKFTKDLAEELEKASQAVLSRSAQQLRQQADAGVAALTERLSAERQRFVAETEKQFEQLRASRQAFLDDTQKELAATARSSMDALTKAAVEKARADLDASKQDLIAESQKELALLSRSSVDALSKDLVRGVVEQAHDDVVSSRQEFIDDTQAHLAKITQASLQELESKARTSVDQAHAVVIASQKRFVDETPRQVAAATQASLESLVKDTVEQGRTQLSHMVDEFLARGIPQIEAELKNLVSRHSEAARAQLAREQAPVAPQAFVSDIPQSAPLHRVSVPGHSLEFALAESAPKRRVDVRDVWASLAFGAKIGLAAAFVMLFLFAIYVSIAPVVRLRPKPPAAFFDESPSWTAKQRAREEELARSYWDIAVHEVEGKYAFGTDLPADPPDNFAVEEKGSSNAAPRVDAAARTRYWQKLREVWPQADSWERTSDWNLDWIRSGWNAASAKLAQVFSPSRTSAAPTP